MWRWKKGLKDEYQNANCIQNTTLIFYLVFTFIFFVNHKNICYFGNKNILIKKFVMILC